MNGHQRKLSHPVIWPRSCHSLASLVVAASSSSSETRQPCEACRYSVLDKHTAVFAKPLALKMSEKDSAAGSFAVRDEIVLTRALRNPSMRSLMGSACHQGLVSVTIMRRDALVLCSHQRHWEIGAKFRSTRVIRHDFSGNESWSSLLPPGLHRRRATSYSA